MVDTKNILIIGCTGSGKSTLANVLFNDEDNFGTRGEFREIFKESEFSVSETKNIQIEEVEIEKKKYRIIDTVGIGNTELDEEGILLEIAKLCNSFKEGISQILFTVGGKITLAELEIYNIIEERLFDKGIVKFITIVRTKSPSFQNRKWCLEDIKLLKEEKAGTSNMVKSCNKFIHIESPSLNSSDYKTEEIVSNKKKRELSRKKVLEHLVTCEENFKPVNLELINKGLEEYTSGNKQLDDELKEYLRNKKEEWKKRKWLEKKMKERVKKDISSVEGMRKSLLKAAIEMKKSCNIM